MGVGVDPLGPPEAVAARRWRLAAQPWGAHLLSAVLDEPGGSRELLYLSPRSAGASSAVRGGVPVLFPQFNELGALPKHGLARTARWQRSALDIAPKEGAAIAFVTEIGPGIHPAFPHTAQLSLAVSASAGRLVMRLQIDNTGHSPFAWTGGLHPYFAVRDVSACRLTGLAGARVADRTAPLLKRQPDAPIAWDGTLFERLFDRAAPLQLAEGARRLCLSMTGFDEWMVWNPGAAAMITDLPPDDWRRFVCIEPVRVSRPVSLAPGESFAGTLQIDCLPA